MKRMNASAARIALPVRVKTDDTIEMDSFPIFKYSLVSLLQTFNGDALCELIKELVRLDKHWIPQEPGYSLYIRPTLSEWSRRCIYLVPLDL